MSRRARRRPVEPPHSALWLAAVGALAAPAILSYVVFLPMPGALPMAFYPLFTALVRMARLAPAFALASSAALVLAWRLEGLSARHLRVALGVVAAAWVVGVVTAGRLAVATRF